MKTGIELIAEERQRQLEIEGYSILEDASRYNEYRGSQNSLCLAAISYIFPDDYLSNRKSYFPWDDQYWKPSPDNRIKELQKAGALIAAEIDRLQFKP